MSEVAVRYLSFTGSATTLHFSVGSKLRISGVCS